MIARAVYIKLTYTILVSDFSVLTHTFTYKVGIRRAQREAGTEARGRGAGISDIITYISVVDRKIYGICTVKQPRKKL